MKYRITYCKNGREKHADFPTMEAAQAVASRLFNETGIVVGIVAVAVADRKR